LSDEALQKLLERAVKYVPGPYNWQASRAILITGEGHIKLWDAIIETYGNDRTSFFAFSPIIIHPRVSSSSRTTSG